MIEALRRSLQDPQLIEKIQKLRQADNYTNFFYLVGVYLFLTAVLGGTIWLYHYQSVTGISFWWIVPVTLAAIILIGAGQHQLAGLGHEGAHHSLFKNRYLNELVSDGFCMFPIFGSTYHYRLEHLGHHQFTNDPERDPDISLLKSSGQWVQTPLSKGQIFRFMLKQLWIPNLIKHSIARTKYGSMVHEKNPYSRDNAKSLKIPQRVSSAYLLGLLGLTSFFAWHGNPWLLAVLPLLGWVEILGYLGSLPAASYQQSRVHPVIPLRLMTMIRMTYLTAWFVGLAWIGYFTHKWAVFYFILLWIIPIFTSFSFFMMIRLVLQHANADRGWLTNTRVFLLDRFFNFCIFPIGQDYHLPHHMFASVPHYRLKKLHKILLEYPDYCNEALIVRGYVFPKNAPQRHPTIVEVLGPEYSPRGTQEIHIDHSALAQDRVEI